MKEFDEFIKTSIHQHFGDYDREFNEDITITTEFDWNHALNIIKDAKGSKFNLLAMTNSNNFNTLQYTMLKNVANIYDITLLPGIELNILNEDKILHLIIIFNPEGNLLEIEKQIDEYIISNNNNYLTIDQLINLIIETKAILIPHGIKQQERSLAENPELAESFYSLKDSFPILIEANQRYHRESLKRKIKEHIIKETFEWIENLATISTADRINPSKIKSPTYFWGDSSFHGLYYAVMMSQNDSKNTRILRKNDIINKSNYIKTIKINSSSSTFIKSVNINCSHGLNTIIGPSGSGKTLLLNLINKKITNNDLENGLPIEGNYDQISDISDIKLLNNKNEEININNLEIFEGENLYNQVLEIHKLDDSQLIETFNIDILDIGYNNIVDNFEKELNTYKNNIIKMNKNIINVGNYITSILTSLDFIKNNKIDSKLTISYVIQEDYKNQIDKIETELETIEDDRVELIESFDKIKILSKKYADNTITEIITELEIELIKNIDRKQKQLEINKTNINIKKTKKDKLKSIIDVYNNSISRVTTEINSKNQIINDSNNSLLVSLKQIYKLKRFNTLSILKEKELLKGFKIPDQKFAKLRLEKFNLIIEKSKLKEVFPNNVSQRTTSSKLGEAIFSKKHYDLSKEEDLKLLMKPFIDEKIETTIKFNLDYKDYLNYKIDLKISDDKYLPLENITAGMLSKIYINNMLEEKLKERKKDVIILYDQPDANMEKAFILEELVNKLQTLKHKYQIFITTHEPLLVINADSNNIIKANNERKYNEPINIEYHNINLSKEDTKENVFDMIAKLIDGSYKAIKFRTDIYGGMKNEN